LADASGDIVCSGTPGEEGRSIGINVPEEAIASLNKPLWA